MAHTVRSRVLVVMATLLVAAVLAPVRASAAAGSFQLSPNEQLSVDQRLISSDGRFVLVMQGDGNLVEYAPGGRAVWLSGTSRGGAIARMQSDGNLVVIAPGNVAVWSSRTPGNTGSVLQLQNDGNLAIYAPGHRPIWSTGIVRLPAYPASFNPSGAGAWATANARTATPDRTSGSSPCTSFVSRSLQAAGMPVDHPDWVSAAEATAVDKYINPPSGIAGPWYNVQQFKQYFLGRGWMKQYTMYPGTNVFPLSVGDVIYYEWNGEPTNSHVHLAIVVRISNGVAYVADQNGESNVGSTDRRWDVSNAPSTIGRPLINLYPRMRSYVLHWN